MATIPTGTLTFKPVGASGVSQFGQATIASDGSFDVSLTVPVSCPPGTYPVTVDYSGDSVYPGFAGQAFGTITVHPPAAQATVSGSFTPTSVAAGGSVTFTGTVTGNQ